MTPPDDVSTRLAEIRERVEAATEGPWLTSPEGAGIYPDTGEVWAPVEESDAVLSHQVVCRMNQHFHPDEDAEFVAATRSDVPYLLSLVEEQRSAMEKAEWAVNLAEGLLVAERERKAGDDVEEMPDHKIDYLYGKVMDAYDALRDVSEKGEQ